jgi:hypothetical protein
MKERGPVILHPFRSLVPLYSPSRIRERGLIYPSSSCFILSAAPIVSTILAFRLLSTAYFAPSDSQRLHVAIEPLQCCLERLVLVRSRRCVP